jgi:glyoxylase-like metal-dependent hydrolase (beta-lactamase superfamily II)
MSHSFPNARNASTRHRHERHTLKRVQGTFTAADGISGIDTQMAGKARVTSAYLVAAKEPLLVETGPARSAPDVRDALTGLGVEAADLAHIVVTHIHLDHAGGAGDFAEAFPRATIWVHERGAAHLADPVRLVASTARTYGADRAHELFGDTKPVPGDRLALAGDNSDIDLGDRRLRILHTPGHASHHLALQDSLSGSIFTGDAVGVHLPGETAFRPAAPPPEFDMELAINSIETIAERSRGAMLFSHFGPAAETDALCALAVQRIREAAETVRLTLERTEDIEAIEQALRKLTADEEADLSASDLAALEISGNMRLNALGLARYWKKRSERDQAESS